MADQDCTPTQGGSSKPAICKGCGSKMPTSARTGQSYCSKSCYTSRAPQIERTCPGCGVKWSAPQSNPSSYCSKDCLLEDRGWEKRAEKACEMCGTFFVSRYRHDHEGWQKFCSQACAGHALRTMETRICACCGAAFQAYPTTPNRTCSKACKDAFYRLERAYPWNGGVYYTGEVKRVKIDRPGYAAKYDAEYRIIAAKAIGRPLMRHESVIHIDHDKTNNSEDNLFICGSRSEQGRRRGGRTLPWPTNSNLKTYDRTGYDVRTAGIGRIPASCGTRPKGGDAHAAPALPSDAVGEAETPNLSRPIPDTLNAGGCE